MDIFLSPACFFFFGALRWAGKWGECSTRGGGFCGLCVCVRGVLCSARVVRQGRVGRALVCVSGTNVALGGEREETLGTYLLLSSLPRRGCPVLLHHGDVLLNHGITLLRLYRDDRGYGGRGNDVYETTTTSVWTQTVRARACFLPSVREREIERLKHREGVKCPILFGHLGVKKNFLVLFTVRSRPNVLIE